MSRGSFSPPKGGIRDRIRSLRRVAVRDLIANPKNWRTHPPAQAAALRGLLSEIGYADALLARQTPEGLMLIDGHLRAEETPPDTKVPVLVLDVSEQEADKLLATLDPLAGMAGADAEALRSLLDGLNTEDEAVEALLAKLRQDAGPVAGLTDPDAVPEPPEEPATKPGDLWLLGEHRLLCGDATSEADVARLLDGARAAMTIADPPYNVGYEYENDRDMRDPQEYALFCESFLSLALQHSGFVAVTPGKQNEALYMPIDKATWNKRFALTGGKVYHAMVTEPILFFGTIPKEKRYATDYFENMTDRELGLRDGHPCPKPVALWEALIEPMTEYGELIYDPFVGSGTTIIACERQGRRCYAMEVEPRYVDVSVRRWEQYIGQKAKRERRRG